MESQYKQEKFFREEFGLIVRRTLVCMCLCVCVHVCLPHTCMFPIHIRVCIFLQTCMLIPLSFPLHMQEPKELPLGDAYYVPAFSGNKRRLVQKKDTFQYVSILDTLQNILKMDVLDYILQPHNREDDLFEDFCDGQRFKSHPFFFSKSQCIANNWLF